MRLVLAAVLLLSGCLVADVSDARTVDGRPTSLGPTADALVVWVEAAGRVETVRFERAEWHAGGVKDALERDSPERLRVVGVVTAALDVRAQDVEVPAELARLRWDRMPEADRARRGELDAAWDKVVAEAGGAPVPLPHG